MKGFQNMFLWFKYDLDMISICDYFMVSNWWYDISVVLGTARKITYVFLVVLNMFLFGVWI